MLARGPATRLGISIRFTAGELISRGRAWEGHSSYEVPMNETSRVRIVAYAVAVLAPAASLLVRWPLWPVLGDAVPHMTFFPAVMVAAYFGGFGPGLLATILSAVAANYLIPQQLPSFQATRV